MQFFLLTISSSLWSIVAFKPFSFHQHRCSHTYQLGPNSKRSALAISSNESDEQDFISSVLYDGTYQATEGGSILSYLPDGGKTMPPRTRLLVSQITYQYVYGIEGQPNLNPKKIAEVMESEYDNTEVSMIVGNRTFGFRGEDLLAIQIASLAVSYRIPSEIMLKILDCAAGENKAVQEFKNEFEAHGWEKVCFPTGLGIRTKKGLVSKTATSSDKYYFPPSRIPWRSRSSNRAAEAARRAIQRVAEAKPPQQTLRTKEEFLYEIENEIQPNPFSETTSTKTAARFVSGSLSLHEALPSFPAERYSLAWTRVKRLLLDPPKNSRIFNNKFSRTVKAQTTKMKAAGRAGLIAYAFLNFVIYTVGMAWQWRHIAIEMPPPAGATLVSLTLRKFLRAFTRVYVGTAVFKVARIALALGLAPAAGRVLQFTQQKLKVSEGSAFVILLTLLVKTFLGTLAIVCLGDTALRTALQT